MIPSQHETSYSKPGQAVETPDSLVESFDGLRMTIDVYDNTSHESPDSKPGQAVETPDSLLSFDKLRMTVGAYDNISTWKLLIQNRDKLLKRLTAYLSPSTGSG